MKAGLLLKSIYMSSVIIALSGMGMSAFADGWGHVDWRRPHFPPPHHRLCAVLYSDSHYRGRELPIQDRELSWSMPSGWNDKVSSARITPGCRLSLYQDSGGRGRRVDLTAASPDENRANFKNIGFNDRVSSFACQCW